MRTVSDLKQLLAHLQPRLHPGRYAFVTLPAAHAIDPAQIVASIREPEGLSAIVPEQIAFDLGLPIAFLSAWIMLTVRSDLAAVGLTAAFSQALAQAGVSCNVVAGTCHDHVFVPADQAQAAMDALHALSRSATAEARHQPR